MNYCPYCGTALVDGAVYFCMECGKKLPDEERGMSQTNGHDEVAQGEVGLGMEFPKENTDRNPSQKASQKQNITRAKEQPVKKKRKPLNLPEEEKQSTELANESQLSVTNPKDDYDGYYDDILPDDEGRFNESMDKNLIKKVIVIIVVVLLIVTLCVGIMYVL